VGERVQLQLSFDLVTTWRERSASRPDRCFPPGKGPPVPIVQEAGWASELVWTQRLEEISFPSAGDRTPVVQSVVRRYTDWVTPAPYGLGLTKVHEVTGNKTGLRTVETAKLFKRVKRTFSPIYFHFPSSGFVCVLTALRSKIINRSYVFCNRSNRCKIQNFLCILDVASMHLASWLHHSSYTWWDVVQFCPSRRH
jgi:hypothetical protein